MINQLIVKRYKILSELGEGGMATVYKALDVRLNREVAIKILHPHIAKHQEFCQRFQQEAAIAAQLVHQNIVQIYDYGTSEDGRTFIISELIRGQDFHRLQLEKLKKDGRPFPPVFCALICTEILNALEIAHNHKYVHRDVKPDNIVMSREGVVKLTDFGIAKDLDLSMTNTGNFLGSPVYSSPEQVQGLEVDFRTDLYSVGIILYEALTARLPFTGHSTSEVMMRIVSGQYVSAQEIFPSVPTFLDNFIKRALQNDKNKRFESTGEMKAELVKFLNQYEIDSNQTSISMYFSNRKAFAERYTKSILKQESEQKTTPAPLKKPVVETPKIPNNQIDAREKKLRVTNNNYRTGKQRSVTPLRNKTEISSGSKGSQISQWIISAAILIFAAIFLMFGLGGLKLPKDFGLLNLNRISSPSSPSFTIHPTLELPTITISTQTVNTATPLPKKNETIIKSIPEIKTPAFNNEEKQYVKNTVKTNKTIKETTATRPPERYASNTRLASNKTETSKLLVPTTLPTAIPTATLTPTPSKVPPQAKSYVTIKTLPGGAAVSIDGIPLGNTNPDGYPKNFEVEPGSHHLFISPLDLQGIKYAGDQKTFSAIAGKNTNLGLIKLTPYRTLTINITGPNVTVKINNDVYDTKNKILILSLPEGELKIIAKASNGKSLKRTIQLTGENFTLNSSLE